MGPANDPRVKPLLRLPIRARIFRLGRWGAACWLGASVLAAATAAEWRLPPIAGELTGEFAAEPFLPGAPRLHWTVRVQPGAAGGRRVVADIEGPGTRLAIEATPPDDETAGEWRITQGELDAGVWFGPVMNRTGGAAGIVASGRLELTGGGAWAGDGPKGTVTLAWRDGALRDEAQGWRVDGITVEGAFELDAASGAVRSAGPAQLTVRTITTKRFGARNLAIRARLYANRTALLESAALEIAGGEIAAAPATVQLDPLQLALDVRLVRVGLQDFAALVPSAVAEASGRLDGQVHLEWSAAGGLRVGAGRLVMRKDEPAELRLAPTPGLISASLPAAVLKYYPGLGEIETGKIPLRAEVLEVAFTPEGDAEGRTATVRLAGGPVDPKLRAPVDLTINVRGPLDLLVKFGTQSNVHFGGGP